MQYLNKQYFQIGRGTYASDQTPGYKKNLFKIYDTGIIYEKSWNGQDSFLNLIFLEINIGITLWFFFFAMIFFCLDDQLYAC